MSFNQTFSHDSHDGLNHKLKVLMNPFNKVNAISFNVMEDTES